MSGITNPSEKYFKDGLWTFDGSVWRPQTQMFGVRSAYAQHIDLASAPTNPYSMSFTVVPAGEIWTVTYVVASNWTDASWIGVIFASIGGVSISTKKGSAMGIGAQIELSCWLVLMPGDKIFIYFADGAVGDNLHGYAIGFKMKIAE